MNKTWRRRTLSTVFLAGIIYLVGFLTAAGRFPAASALAVSPEFTRTQTPSTPVPLPTLPVSEGTRISPSGGMVEVFIPGGEFRMGSSEAEIEAFLAMCHDCSSREAFKDEQPQHTVDLGAYWIDKTEVTNAMYDVCARSGGCTPPIREQDDSENSPEAHFPVNRVSWGQAKAYCEWAGRRLPTEAEWEKAARGTDGRIYPWGNEPPDCIRANYVVSETLNTIRRCTGTLQPVGSYPSGASPYGVLDMAGNVSEWVNDRYDPGYYQKSPAIAPPGPIQGLRVVLRGGGWSNTADWIRTAHRSAFTPLGADFAAGFRCARSASDPEAASQALRKASQGAGVVSTLAKLQTPTRTPLPAVQAPPVSPPAPTRPAITSVSRIDGMPQVYVPAGEFTMGAPTFVITASTYEMPQKRIYLDAFWIDQREVSNGMYSKCVQDGACRSPYIKKSHTRAGYYGNPAYQEYPVVYVDWNQARDYCAWAGRRLPGEAEWEKAARGTDGRLFPWGSQSPNCKLLNYGGFEHSHTAKRIPLG